MNIRKILVIVFLGTFLFGALMIYGYRDIVFRWDFAKPVGAYEFEDKNGLSPLVNDFMESQFPGKTCVNHWFGNDDRYIYVDVVCGTFLPQENGDIFLDRGFAVMTRIEWDKESKRLIAFKQPKDGADYFPSYQHLFPKFVYSMDRARTLEDHQKLMGEGLKRQETKKAGSTAAPAK